jgi:hypothetical protein
VEYGPTLSATHGSNATLRPMNHLYRVIGYDAQDQRLFDETVEAPVKGIAEVMVLAQLYRNFATSALADRANRLVTRREDK